ncbi:MAG: hypothetical protein ABSD29_10200 [Verrucomicrobiota bacterium]
MSLINDALRRAKDAQQQVPLPPSPHLPFRPVEPAPPTARRSLGLFLPTALAVAALLALLFVWERVQRGHSTGPTEVNARTARVASPVGAPRLASVSPATAATAPALATQPGPAAQSASPPSPLTGATATLASNASSAATNAPAADAQQSEVTNTAAMTPPPPPKPAPLRLQGIVFNPRRPSAMISGRTLFVGDKLGDLRVVAIDQQSATLAGAGQTNVLSLSE